MQITGCNSNLIKTASAFVNPSNVKTPEKMDKRELTRAIRQAIAAEEEAVHLYETIADASDDKLVVKAMKSIGDEERVHIGELQKLLEILLPDEKKHIDEGKKEVEEMEKEK